MDLKQPVAGIAATAIVITIALVFVSLFKFEDFVGWVAYYLLCIIPMQIVVGITWNKKHPGFAQRAQPAKGILLTLIALVTGAIVAPIYMWAAGGGISPPTPMLAQCTIVSVVITFWIAIMWGGWPFSVTIRNPVASGLVMLAACYIVNYALFRVFFNYAFMSEAPVYVASLDPHGLFNGWSALVFYVTALAAMFLMLHFDLWPLTKFPVIMKQPALGIVWTIVVLVLGGSAFAIGTRVLGMDVVRFLVTAPIPFIFGTIIVLNVLQNSLFGRIAQPGRGVLNAIAAVAIGTVLARVYGYLAPSLTGLLHSGPPTYDFEIWLASALLSVTFPFLIIYAEFFSFWPLTKAGQERSAK